MEDVYRAILDEYVRKLGVASVNGGHTRESRFAESEIERLVSNISLYLTDGQDMGFPQTEVEGYRSKVNDIVRRHSQ